MALPKAMALVVIFPAVVAVSTLRWSADSDASQSYATVSNKGLQSAALTLVKKIRQLVYAYNRKDKDLMADYQTTFIATRTTERQKVRDEWRRKSEENLRFYLRDYEKSFLSDAVRMREELYRRLPKRLQRADSLKLYKNPPNMLAVDAIADDLELLSKSLPDG